MSRSFFVKYTWKDIVFLATICMFSSVLFIVAFYKLFTWVPTRVIAALLAGGGVGITILSVCEDVVMYRKLEKEENKK